MSYRTSIPYIVARNLGRSLGVNSLLARLLGSSKYEDRFGATMLSSIKKNDCIWDVGANVGLYTTKFSEATGENGVVYAFEPSPQNESVLSKNVTHYPNVRVIPVALGRSDGTMKFQQGEDESGATSKVLDEATVGQKGTLHIDMKTADSCIADGIVTPPNFVKIDVEGFELDVLQGMSACLANLALRVICIEIHFGLLSERGMADAPSEIESLLLSEGFRCDWSDASHIIATRV